MNDQNSLSITSTRRILLVDDDPIQLKLNCARLIAAGFTVDAVTSASRALLTAHKHRPDLVASDVLMGELDGFNLCRMIRAERALDGVPVLLISAHFDDVGDRKLAQAVGAADLVMRTPDFAAELGAIERALAAGSTVRRGRHSMDTDTSDLYGERVAAQLARQFEKTRAAETRYQTLFEAATDAIALLDEDGVVLEVNRRWEEILGLPREQIVGHSIREFARTDQAEANVEFVQHVATCAGPGQSRYAVKSAEGTIVWMEGGATPIQSDGRTIVFAISRDITAAVKAEEQLARSEARYRSLVDNIPDMVWTADGHGDLVFVGANAERITTYTPAEMIAGSTSANLVHPADKDRVLVAWQAFVAGEAPFDIEYRRARRDGGWMWVHNRAVVPREVDGEMFVDGVLTDISDRKRLEEQMRQAQKMEAIGQLSGGIAHDFNNLLSVILANCQFLMEALSDQDPRRLDALEIEAAGQRAAALTRQLLAFSRRQALSPMLTDLSATVGGLEKMLHRLIGEDIELTVDKGQGIGGVRVDLGQIEQVVMNLAINARDAMPDGGALTIEVANLDLGVTALDEVPPGRYVVISVTDTGCGMDAETKKRIFEPFFTTKEVGKGTGLGLSTCYGIVRQSGGFIWVYSEVGSGTTFKVFLPRADGEAVAAPEAMAQAPGGSETVLVIEDDDRVRAAVVRMLGARGYHALSAHSAADALAVVAAYGGTLDLVLSDLILPGARGTDAVQQVRQLAPHVRALFMSGYTDHVALRSGMLEDGRCFIEKPFGLDALAHKVREILDTTANAVAA